ncbi:MAG: cytochrome c3 family protein [Gemmatimonadaceae bacterium]
MLHRHRKRLYQWSTAIALVLVAPGLASAQTITGTKHDLSAGGAGIAAYGQVCVYCHAPHNAAASAPLWNRGMGAGPYTLYTSTTSSTIDMTVAATPGSVSKACLSCHDGTIGLDVVTNVPTGAPASIGTGKITGGALIGTDLTNDHPIAVTYDPTKDTQFNAVVSGKVDVLPLYGTAKNQLECATCHNVHSNAVGPFLRKTNAGSALCLTCHKK